MSIDELTAPPGRAESGRTTEPEGPYPGPRPLFWMGVLPIAAVKLLVHLYTSGRYGYHHDELLFLAESTRLDWGFVDSAPGAAVYAFLSSRIFGDSLTGVRLLPTLAGTAKVVLTGAIAARVGGGRAAQVIACLAALIAPVFLALDGYLSMNCVEPLFWMGAAYLLVAISQTGAQKLWLWIGVLIGLGLQNKHSTAFFALALASGVLLTPLRRSLASAWPWTGAVIAFLLFLPNVVWQVRHDFPTLELLRNVKEAGPTFAPGAFLASQILMLHPCNAPLWLCGLAWLLFAPSGRPYRALGITYLALLGMFIGLEAKNYYLQAAYPMLMAAGAVVAEASLRKRALFALASAMAVGGSGTALLEMPLLTIEHNLAVRSRLAGLAHRLGIVPRVSNNAPGVPPGLAAQFGWEEMTAQVARAYHALPPEQRDRTAIFVEYYPLAAAIEFFGRKHGLPPPISANQQYFLWGPRGWTGESMIVVEQDKAHARFEHRCGEFRPLGRFYHPYGPTWANREFFLCRDLMPELAQLWPKLKWYGY